MSKRTPWGERVRSTRKAANLTQQDLSEMVACHPTTISDIEVGRTLPSDLLKVRLARALDVDPAELFPLADLSDFVEVGE
jgi:transcriptional regulator with XRE-family HTH domain